MTHLPQHNQTRGFTLILAVLIISLVLTLGLSLARVSTKEKVLSRSGRDSQIAFHAADSGMECALYFDLKDDDDLDPFDTTGSYPSITCNGETVTQSLQSGYGGVEPAGEIHRQFEIDFTDPAKNIEGCAVVTVDKIAGDTTIRSRGRNTCDTSAIRRVERGIETTYSTPTS